MSQTQYSIEELPVEIRISVGDPGGTTMLATAISAIGLVIAVVGGLFIMFGPDTIYYDVYEGMTFTQFLQAYPGPIATVGFVLVTIGSAIKNKTATDQVNAIQQQVFQQLAFSPADIPEGKRLSIAELGEGHYEVSLADEAPVQAD